MQIQGLFTKLFRGGIRMRAATAAVSVMSMATIAKSQEQIISENAFRDAINRSQRPVAEWRGRARRISKINEESFSILPGMDHRYRHITEHDASGSTRSFWEAVTGNNVRRGEVVKIANLEFKRDGLGSWVRNYLPATDPEKPTLPFESSDSVDSRSLSIQSDPGATTEYKYRTSANNGKQVSVYRRVMTSILSHPRDGSEIRKETINEYWMDRDGRLIRYEQWINHSGKHFQSRQRIGMEWESDPSIVVSAPIKSN
jgi:hypothetical protein